PPMQDITNQPMTRPCSRCSSGTAHRARYRRAPWLRSGTSTSACTGRKARSILTSTTAPFALRGARRGKGFQPLPIPEHLLGGTGLGCDWVDTMGRIFRGQPVGTRLFIDCILQGKPITPNFHDGMKAQAVIEAAFESDRTGCWVDVP